MDLNFQYAEHQQSLMLAMTTTNISLRTRHLESADSVAARIRAWQHAEGANAAKGWAFVMDDAEIRDLPILRITA